MKFVRISKPNLVTLETGNSGHMLLDGINSAVFISYYKLWEWVRSTGSSRLFILGIYLVGDALITF